MITTSAHGYGLTVTAMGFMTTTEKETCEREGADLLAGLDAAAAQELHTVLKRSQPFYKYQLAWKVSGELQALGERLLTKERWRSCHGWFKLGHVP